MAGLQELNQLSENLPYQEELSPLFFIGHGSPMNGIEQNNFSASWQKLGQQINPPKAVLVISAHWLTNGTYVTAMENPRTIHDFTGFPPALSKVQYPAPGAPELARELSKSASTGKIGLDHEWGLDHGTWSVVRHMFPGANIPVLQLSIDYHRPALYHYQLARELQVLRKKGVLIIGSGNMIHNLRMIAWDKFNVPGYGYDWAQEINATFKENILLGEHDPLIHYERLGKAAELAIPTPDHYFPLIYTLGLQSKQEPVTLFNDELIGGSMNMTSVMYGKDLFLQDEVPSR